MTERIFYEDQYIKEFKAKVIKIEEKDNKYYVQLNRTAFFPGGGGQSCDLGSIEGHEVIDVFEDKKQEKKIKEEMQFPSVIEKQNILQKIIDKLKSFFRR